MQDKENQHAANKLAAESNAAESCLPAKRSFESQKLTLLGDVRTLTMGTSPGAGDSSNPAIFKP